MPTEKFVVQNVKCQGCVSAIKNGLKTLPGVDEVEVDIESGQVSVQGQGLARADIAAKLGALGYPERP